MISLPKAPADRGRLISVIAATIISLGCGTNYVYSAWAPQFAQQLKLSSTESNLIGTFGNLGMYLSGIPFGMLIDAWGPRWGVGIGGILLGAGYYPIHIAYQAGAGKYSVATLCFFSYLTGAGSCSAFSASIKVSALNYPDHRGTATAFPLAAFGLSAFFFSILGTFLYEGDDISKFLLTLATGTFTCVAVSFFFLRVYPQTKHKPSLSDSQNLHRTRSDEQEAAHKIDDDEDSREEHSSLLSSSSGSAPGDVDAKVDGTPADEEQHHLDVRGLKLLPIPEFWQLFLMLGFFCGIGLMTINNIGNDAQALWKHYDNKTDPSFIQKRQAMHVSILSFFSFSGRLLSGIGSDVLVKKLHMSRFWCLFFSAVAFCAAQASAVSISNPHLLGIVSGLTGLAYGVLFGVYPSLIAHAFGVHGLSQNWGTMTLSPVIFGNVFNIFYGWIYDSNSIVEDDGSRECLKGLGCYRTAYWVTLFAGIGGVGVCLWTIWHENQIHRKKRRRDAEHEREA